tara:strand:- start:493 stop:714 length:222 start_codon:yes stop_codon:yes gene_type:complete
MLVQVIAIGYIPPNGYRLIRNLRNLQPKGFIHREKLWFLIKKPSTGLRMGGDGQERCQNQPKPGEASRPRLSE